MKKNYKQKFPNMKLYKKIFKKKLEKWMKKNYIKNNSKKMKSHQLNQKSINKFKVNIIFFFTIIYINLFKKKNSIYLGE